MSIGSRRLLAQILLVLGFLGHIFDLYVLSNVLNVPYYESSAGVPTIFMVWVFVVFAPLLGSMALVFHAGKLMERAKANQ